jgi:hypothetical protein
MSVLEPFWNTGISVHGVTRLTLSSQNRSYSCEDIPTVFEQVVKSYTSSNIEDNQTGLKYDMKNCTSSNSGDIEPDFTHTLC